MHPQILRDTGDPPFIETNRSRRGAELGIGDQLRLDELNDPTALSAPLAAVVLFAPVARPDSREEDVRLAVLRLRRREAKGGGEAFA